MLLQEFFSENFISFFAVAARFLIPVPAVLIIIRCIRSMLSERYEPETWGYLYLPGNIMVPIKHWECIIGRGKSADATINNPSISKIHACLMRAADGTWTVYPLARSNTRVNGEKATREGLEIQDADVLSIGSVNCRFVDLTEEERGELLSYRHAPGKRVHPAGTFFYLTIFQALLAFQHCAYNPEESLYILSVFGAFCALMWAYFFVILGVGARGFEADTLAFFLTTLGLSVVASADPEGLIKQFILSIAGIVLFIIMSLWLRDLQRIKKFKWPAGIIAIILLLATMLLAKVTNGAQNWIYIGGFSLQPSEFVKVCYLFAGAATLERLFVNRNLIFFIGFSAACVGCLALMGDFGTALIFFITFLIIAFMRSGSFATIFLAVGSAAIAVMFILTVRPYIASRFETWGHVWEDVYGGGWQQAQAMSAAASGGLFGTGAGNGWLHDVFAGSSDMVWAMICEESGLLVGLCCIAAILVLAFFVVKNTSYDRSSYYAIAACGAVSMMMIQMALNVFGTMDILPFTGVTFPFVSQGGSSLLSCWMLIAFIKACDTRANASFAVKRPEAFGGGVGVESSDEYYPEDYDGSDSDDYEWTQDNGGDFN